MGVAIVTGGSRGIGRQVCRALASKRERVVVTARDKEQAELVAAGLPRAHALVLDVTDPVSIKALVAAVDEVDVLVNNAGIALDGFDDEVVRRTLEVNVHGALRVTRALLPKLRRGARVVMVSSGMGELSCLAPALRERFLAAADTDTIKGLLDEFSAAVAAGEHEALGWPSSAYRVSKAALNMITRILAAQHPELHINAVCPGWVRTDMGGPHASRSVEDGADGVVWAAELGPDGPTGGFFRDRQKIAW